MESTSDPGPLKELMRGLPLLQGLAPEDLDLLHAMSSVVGIDAGAFLMREGEPGETLYVIIEGELEVLTSSGQVVATRGHGEVVGEMAVLQRAPRSASVRALRAGRLLAIGHHAFATLLSRSPTASFTLLGTVVDRLRSSELMLMQNEKIAALGTMAAGLAHELNNPAAAISRSTGQLRDALAAWERATAEVAGLDLDGTGVALVTDLRAEVTRRAAEPPQLDPLTRSEREDALLDWLEEIEAEPAWELAPVLVESGWDDEALRTLMAPLTAEPRAAVVRWLAAGSALYALLEETRTSADVISHLVRSVKSYAYLDQAPVQDVDIHKGLEDTLVILKHKLGSAVSVHRVYDPDLPHVEAFGSELNQVWTNLIDNAIDAMEGGGRLELTTHAREDRVEVEIRDDGPGIPDEIRQRILEPFFTTKQVGSGMGLGMHIVYDIVVRRHRGHLYIDSEPGSTTIKVVLPLTLER
jgi:signal transduction histidine kinase